MTSKNTVRAKRITQRNIMVCSGRCMPREGQMCCAESSYSVCLLCHLRPDAPVCMWASGGFKTFMLCVTGYLVPFSPQTGFTDLAKQILCVKMTPRSYPFKDERRLVRLGLEEVCAVCEVGKIRIIGIGIIFIG